MKTFLLMIILVLAVVNCLHAQQPALLSDEMAPFGTVFKLKQIQNLNIIDTTIQGAGVTWDFTGLTNDPFYLDLIVTITDPAQTPYSSDFPNANYSYKEEPSTAYRYFYLDTSKMERIGSWSGGVLKTYNDPQVEYVFPLTLGVSNFDTWDNDQSSSG